VARTAAKALSLDRVIFLVSPQNPLKKNAPPQARRIAATRRLARDPRFSVSGLEADLGSPYTIDTVRFLKARYPAVRFVWIIGSDNLLTLPRWRAWRAIVREIPIAVMPRSGSSVRGRLSPAWRHIGRFGQGVFLDGPLNFSSSTALREGGTDWSLP
jgi:nicotinate-nucleotide adenylyltransferase